MAPVSLVRMLKDSEDLGQNSKVSEPLTKMEKILEYLTQILKS